jgi:tRNA(Ile)-lysidine synthase
VLVEYGTVRFTREGAAAAPAGVRLVVPGEVEFGDWTVSARLGGFGDAELDAEALGDVLTVRAWKDGDRIRPLGLDGTKSLQDVFTDRKVPRELRRTLPVVLAANGEIAWVAGAEVVGERFRAVEGRPTVALSARRRT